MHHRFYVPSWSERAEITSEEFHHGRVVRLREGEEIELFDGKGRAATAVVESIGDRVVSARVVAPIESREPLLRIHLAMAVINLEKFELVLQKATELGAASIIPLVTSRVEVRPERYRGKEERWQKIVFEAVKQCGRAVIPAVEEAAKFEDVLARPETKILFDLSGTPMNVGAGFSPPRDGLKPVPTLTLLIGPEGGWSEEELDEARAAGCMLQRLGPRRLRAETAAIAALTAAGLFYGDLSGGAA